MNVKLKKVTESDAGLIVKWRNENKEYFGTQEGIDRAGHRWWYANTYLYDLFDNYYMVYADGQPVGTISMNTCTHEIGRVLLGYKKFARQGIMGEALEQVMSAHYNYWYILNVLESNQDAIAFYRKHDFAISRYHSPRPGMALMERSGD